MAWVKLDDRFPDHPKVAAAGPLASWLYVAGLAYATRHRTGNFLPEADVHRLTTLVGLQIAITRLLEAGMWARVEGGYVISDWLGCRSCNSRKGAN